MVALVWVSTSTSVQQNKCVSRSKAHYLVTFSLLFDMHWGLLTKYIKIRSKKRMTLVHPWQVTARGGQPTLICEAGDTETQALSGGSCIEIPHTVDCLQVATWLQCKPSRRFYNHGESS